MRATHNSIFSELRCTISKEGAAHGYAAEPEWNAFFLTEENPR
jgi:hypothetical protein